MYTPLGLLLAALIAAGAGLGLGRAIRTRRRASTIVIVAGLTILVLPLVWHFRWVIAFASTYVVDPPNGRAGMYGELRGFSVFAPLLILGWLTAASFVGRTRPVIAAISYIVVPLVYFGAAVPMAVSARRIPLDPVGTIMILAYSMIIFSFVLAFAFSASAWSKGLGKATTTNEAS